MAEDGEVAAGNPLTGGTFSQLLFFDDDNVINHSSSSAVFPDQNHPKMLCFGDFDNKFNVSDHLPARSRNLVSVQKSGVTCTAIDSSSSVSSTNNTKSIKNRKRNEYENFNNNGYQNSSTGACGGRGGAPARSQRMCKKIKSENSPATGHAKVKKEKLGERVAALQQLVSPYGKTDTASVLHEAMGYIKFLQQQVKALCSPYLERLPSASDIHPLLHEGKEKETEELLRNDLRSKGLCLVPVDWTLLHVVETNGADFWSPATVYNGCSSQHSTELKYIP